MPLTTVPLSITVWIVWHIRTPELLRLRWPFYVYVPFVLSSLITSSQFVLFWLFGPHWGSNDRHEQTFTSSVVWFVCSVNCQCDDSSLVSYFDCLALYMFQNTPFDSQWPNTVLCRNATYNCLRSNTEEAPANTQMRCWLVSFACLLWTSRCHGFWYRL
jgi:hypothetical protein